MISKILITTYSIVFSFVALACIYITWVNDPMYVLIMETLVNISIATGCWLALLSKQYKWWLIVFIIAFAFEAYLLINDQRVGIKETFQWVGILLPAIFLNLKVAGILKS